MIRLLLTICFLFSSTVIACAQCPGGNCGGAAFSSPQVQYYMQPQQQYYQSYQQSYRSSGSSWSYPGDVASHLMRDHGINPAGMSHAQMVQLHNNLHNSQRGVSRTVIRTASRPRFFRRW